MFKYINILNLSRKKISYKYQFIDKLIYDNNPNNDSIELINKLRILILINIFHFENNNKYANVKQKVLFLQSSDPEQNEIYNLFENILWVVKQIKLGKIYIPLNDIYKLFNFVEEKFINHINKPKKENNLHLFFIGGYPLNFKK